MIHPSATSSTSSSASASQIDEAMKQAGKLLTSNARDALAPELQYRVLAESIPSIVWTARPDGYVDYYNQRWYEYTGLNWPQSEQLGASPVMTKEDYARTIQMWNHSIATGETYEIEYCIRRASDHMFRWHLGRAVPLRDTKGHIIKWFGSCTDIHDQKMAQEKIARVNQELEERVEERTREVEQAQEKDRINSARLHSVIDSMTLGAVLSDESRIILRANDRFCQLFNLSAGASDLVGKPVMEVAEMVLQKLQQPDVYRERFLQVLQTNQTQSNVELLLKDGRVLSRDYVPILVGGVRRGQLFLYRDISKERRLDAAKSEFMSLASHQLRTPLTAIRWALARLQRLKGETYSDHAKDLLDAAKNASAHMANTITTMLSISRIESGTMHLEQKQVRLLPLIQDLERQCRDEYLARQQTCIIDCSEDVVLETDGNLLREVLLNLLSNSVKYSPKGGSIGIRAFLQGDTVVVRVSDTGYGIPAYQHDKIFSKFFRGANILQLNTDGTGLGLYLVSRLVGMLSGTINFDSVEGKGTTFQLIFPKNPAHS